MLAPAVVARFTDSAGVPVLEAESAADAAYLRPGERSTFRVTVLHPLPFLQLAALTVKGAPSACVWPLDGAQGVEARGAFEEVEQDRIHTIAGCDPEKHACFFVERVKLRTDNYRVEGTVVNSASQPVRNVRVTVALSDAEGRLVNVGVGPVAPPTLLPGQRAGFAVLVYWAPGTMRFEARAHSDD
ncbi:MAG: FxLYD domain-containing protein [Chloroflexi bacterium]|nr:FxLYD domain-containing protein [Chloroflexota bacterium]